MKRSLLLLGFMLTVPGAARELFARPDGSPQPAGNTSGSKENLDLPYDAIGEEDVDEDSPEVIQFYGQNYEGHGIFFAIDRSGSMQDSGELTVAKREVVRTISEFSSRVEFGIVFFARDAVKFPTSGTPAKANPSTKQSGIAWVRGMQSAHASCPQQGLVQALQMANKADVKSSTLIYVGDGGGTCNGDEATYLRQTLAVVKGQNYKRAQINSIGVLIQTQSRDDQVKHRDFLRQLATMNGGRYTEVSH
jgi:Mg-chelatase subunit ChlD